MMLSCHKKLSNFVISRYSVRHFCSAKVAPLVSSGSLETTEQNEESKQLKFVRSESNLRQVFIREPDDGLFPMIKAIDKMEAEDVEILIKANLKDVLKKVIDRE